MISGVPSLYPNTSQTQNISLQMYPEDHVINQATTGGAINEASSSSSSSETTQHANSLLYSLSFLKDKVQQIQSLISIIISPPDHHTQPVESTTIAIANMTTMIQEIIMTASSMLFTCQQLVNSSGNNQHLPIQHHDSNKILDLGHERGVNVSLFSPTTETFDWYASSDNNNNNNNNNNNDNNNNDDDHGQRISINNKVEKKKFSKGVENFVEGYDIIELDAADLLAKYTHYCQVCGKGFKRDANLRMHMRAHGDEYKTNAALSNPMKNNGVGDNNNNQDPLKLPRKYSCPHEGCRWNKNHEKFQPLKSMVCVKNHYKRSHCPKMYVCKRCNRKQFSVLSDLRTHEKHCGDLKWQCSCGTTFSRKDKLMGHVALFVGHTPATTTTTALPRPAKVEKNQPVQMHIDDRG